MKPVVVGVDGSPAAITAALWGADEAHGRAVPLRLISVIKTTHPSPEDYERDLRHAETSLRAAQVAVAATGKQVKVETDTPRRPARFSSRPPAMPNWSVSDPPGCGATLARSWVRRQPSSPKKRTARSR